MQASADIRPESSVLQLGPETAHILFMDMVGYSRLHTHDQRTAQDDLRRAVQATEDYRAALADDQLICRPAGDGMALLFFGSALAPVRCAVQITDAMRNHPHIRLRMGINTGPVLRVQDINAHSDIAGEGIVVAQRVMDLGDAGHILLSGTYKLALDTIQDFRYPMGHLFLTDLGNCTVKHGHTVRVFGLRDRQFGALKFGNAIVPRKMRPTDPVLVSDLPPPPLMSSLANAVKITVAGILFVVFLFCVALAYREYRHLYPPNSAETPSTSPPAAGGRPSLAGPAQSGVATFDARVFVNMRWAQARKLAAKYDLTLYVDNEIRSPEPFPNDTISKLSHPDITSVHRGDTLKVIVFHRTWQPHPAHDNSGSETISDPTITSLSPASAAASPTQQTQTLTVRGSGFMRGATVVWNGDPLPTRYVSSTKITASITADMLQSPAEVSVYVSNPDPGGASDDQNFEITDPPDPTPAAGGSG